MYLILQQEKPEDFVIATGVTTEIRDFVKMSFAEIGVDIEFRGNGENERGYVTTCHNPEYNLEKGREVVAVDPRYFRPTEVELLVGDATKARTKLNWRPEYDLEHLVKDMVQSDIKLMRKDVHLQNGGYQTLNYFE